MERGDFRAGGGDSINASNKADFGGWLDVGPKRNGELFVRRVLALCSTKLEECPLRRAGLKHVGILRLDHVSVSLLQGWSHLLPGHLNPGRLKSIICH